ncbi:hypothetical protein RHMOL_Rhmol03G0062800 [Rhododendron molle]|uniref:Uncharacterized protein n=1 Tax=Rhododendron molle TaxID=49168 RepID=A0ACC0PAT8_RHOML|nr:hypothetical protein RHMOL_Rhmol03G0062800 [Rhododendron molle]
MEEVRDEPGPHSSLTERIDDDDEDQPALSAQALEALREFLGEQNRAPVADDEAAAAGNGVTSSSEVALLAEDWRLSQFWYDPDTAETVAREVLSLCGSVESPSVACIACPTLYAYLKIHEPLVCQWYSSIIDYMSAVLGLCFDVCLFLVCHCVNSMMAALVSGEVQKDRAAELLDLYPCGFRPRHSSKLGNEFLLFTNYDPGMRLGGWERDQ